jgi:hypothetical protein
MADTSRLRAGVEIAALIVGLVLGVNTLWQTLRPTTHLVADILITHARLPPDLDRDAKALPGRLQHALLEHEAIKKAVPQEALRKEVAGAAGSVAKGLAESLTSPLLLRDNLVVISVQNTGPTTLSDVQLSFRHWMNGTVIVRQSDRTESEIDTNGLLKLGDLRPQASVELFAWGLGVLSTSSPDVLLTHKDGVGVVRTAAFISPELSRYGGVYFSYQQTTLALLALLLFGGGLLGLARLRRQSLRL